MLDRIIAFFTRKTDPVVEAVKAQAALAVYVERFNAAVKVCGDNATEAEKTAAALFDQADDDRVAADYWAYLRDKTADLVNEVEE